MPELPEVQTIVGDLNKKIIGKRIVGVWFDAPKLIKRPKAEDLENQIKGLRIKEIKRRGKNILIYLGKPKTANSKSADNKQLAADDMLLLIHQKMTGHLLVGKWSVRKTKTRMRLSEDGRNSVISLIKGPLNEKVNNYIHVIFYLDSGEQLALSDLRKFAKVVFGKRNEIENIPELKKLGIDPLDGRFTFEKFNKIIRSLPGKIKQILMDQEKISGIGNIYSDEILWKAQIHPLRRANSLSEGELKKIYKATGGILKKAIKLRGTSISDFRDTAGKSGNYGNVRSVYRKEGRPCPVCGGKIERIRIGGRSAHFCPVCQKL